MEKTAFRESISSAIAYWEPRRLVYNAVLAAIVAGYYLYFLKTSPSAKTNLSFDNLSGLFVLAVLANVAYCAAYVVDLFAQWSVYREAWCRHRWILFLVGMLLAATLTRFMSIGAFSPCCG